MITGSRKVDELKSAAAALGGLDAEEARLVSLLDRDAALRAVAATLPELTGFDTAIVGEFSTGDSRRVTLRVVRGGRGGDGGRSHPVDGLVIPSGLGLGGLVMMTGRPHGVSDYCRATTITHDFDAQVREAGIRGMIAVPVAGPGAPLGILYGASTHRTHLAGRRTATMVAAAGRAANAAQVAERARHAAEVAVHEERRRLALEMHDSVGALLFAIGAGARKLEDDTALPPELRSRLAVMSRQAAEAADTLRRSLRAMHTPAASLALDVALRADCRAFEARSGTPAKLIDLTDVAALPAARTHALVAAAREALLNVEKHASARGVAVTVAARKEYVTVTVVDDGIGLHASRDQAEALGSGLGLAAVAERLRRVGGGLDVGGNEDGGVTVRAWVPE